MKSANHRLLSSEIVFNQHNHETCIDQAITLARSVCEKNNYKLTALRQTILEIIWQDHKPIGAYSIIHILSELSAKQIAPPTVYRVLDFLISCGLIHKIASQNAFIGCSYSHEEKNQCAIFICQCCNGALEVASRTINGAVRMVARTNQFVVNNCCMEFSGICIRCKLNPDNKR